MPKVPVSSESALTVPAPASNALAIPSAEQMDEGFISPSSSGNYLPLIEMVFPIMQTPEKPWYNNKNYKIGFRSGNDFEVLPVGSIITTIDKRNVIREAVVDAAGQKANKYHYAPIVRGTTEYGQSVESYKALLPKANTAGLDMGVSCVVAIIMPDNRVVVGNFSAWKTMHGYIMPLLCATKIQAKAGLKLGIEDHTPNLTKSKTSGFHYPDHKKFKQFEQVMLTPEHFALIEPAVNAAAESYMEWLKK